MAAPEWRITVETLKRLAVPKGREACGQFSLEGYRSLERALRNRAPITCVLAGESVVRADTAREQNLLRAVKERNIPLHIAPDAELAGLTRGRGLGDVFALMPIPEAPTWNDLFDGPGFRLAVVGWNLGDPGNVGALIRTSLAAGATGFVAVGTSDPWHPKAVRTSMGSLFALPVLRVPDTEEWLDALRAENVETLATDCRGGEALPDAAPSRAKAALILGSEAFGLPENLLDRLDRKLRIPMPPGVDSYSINAAAAILAYTLIQRAPAPK